MSRSETLSRARTNPTPGPLSACLLALAAACFAGCIENPGPDPLLGVPKPQTAGTQAIFQQAHVLEFRLARDSGRTRLAVRNASLEALDSASFHLEFTLNGFRPYYELSDYASRSILLEYFGKVGPLAPGASQDLGILDSTEKSALSGRYLTATLISLHRNGASQGSPFAGAFRGTYLLWDTQGKSTAGPLRGMINADGRIRIGLLATSDLSIPRWFLSGMVRADGKVGDPPWEGSLRDNYQRRQLRASGTLQPMERGFSAAFNFYGDGAGWVDSLDLQLDSHPTP